MMSCVSKRSMSMAAAAPCGDAFCVRVSLMDVLLSASIFVILALRVAVIGG